MSFSAFWKMFLLQSKARRVETAVQSTRGCLLNGNQHYIMLSNKKNVLPDRSSSPTIISQNTIIHPGIRSVEPVKKTSILLILLLFCFPKWKAVFKIRLNWNVLAWTSNTGKDLFWWKLYCFLPSSSSLNLVKTSFLNCLLTFSMENDSYFLTLCAGVNDEVTQWAASLPYRECHGKSNSFRRTPAHLCVGGWTDLHPLDNGAGPSAGMQLWRPQVSISAGRHHFKHQHT